LEQFLSGKPRFSQGIFFPHFSDQGLGLAKQFHFNHERGGSMRRASLAGVVFFLICSCVSFASYSRSNSMQHQFHFSSKFRAQTSLKRKAQAKPANSLRGTDAQRRARENRALSAAKLKARKNLKARRHANPPTGKLGFVSATQVPAGGQTYWDAAKGDFNGDGKPDVATIVENYDITNDVYTYALSVVLGNGDGTFKAPALTSLADSCSVFAVGDFNGDKKDDVLIVHIGGECSNTSSTFDVLISNGDGTFTLKNTTPYAISPNWLRGGTLAVTTKSGFLDLVAVDYPTDGETPSSVVTVPGNGDGTFSTTPTSVALSRLVDETAIADLNGDGILDVVGRDDSTAQVTVFLATSPTAFAAGVPYTTPDDYYEADAIMVGDLTNDGKPEIVTPNWTGNISVYVNNGDGSFQPAVYYNAVSSGPNGAPGVTEPTAVSIADVNGDGNADLVSSNAESGDITILLGNGDGTLKVPTFGYAVGGESYDDPRSPAIVADFDGDGFVDIVVPDYAFSLAYLKGYNDGTFRAALSYYAPAMLDDWAYAIGMASADFNGDGIPDIVIAADGDANIAGVTVFLSRGDGSLKPGVTYGTSDCYSYVVVADFDKDGQPDIASNNHCTGEVQIFTGKKNGTFIPGPAVATDVSNTYPSEMVVSDFDGDGYSDVAVINENGGSGYSNVAVILNDGTGNFKPAVTYALSVFTYQGITVGDLNSDGKPDLVVPYNWSSSVAVLLGMGDGTFTQQPDVPVGTPGSDTNCSITGLLCPAAVTLADVDGDGNMDIVASLVDGGGQDIVILPGTGTTEGVPAFGTPTYLASSLQLGSAGWPYPSSIQALDIDGDKNLDLVYANASYGTLGVLYGAGSGKFYDPVEYPVGGWPWRFAVTDFNNDGTKDIVVADNAFSGVTVLLNAAGTGTVPNYAVSVDSDTQTVTVGGSATYNFTMTPSNHYDGTITFACTGLPDKSSCTFNPTSAVMDGHTPTNVQLTIATTAQTTSTTSLHSHTSIMFAMSLSGMGLFGMLVIGSLPKRRRLLGIMLGIVIVTMMISLVGCGGSSNNHHSTIIPGTPAGSYTVTVTATGTAGSYGGSTSDHVMTITLAVQ
jgi:hypothetical protein